MDSRGNLRPMGSAPPYVPKTFEQKQDLAKRLSNGEPVTKALAAAGWADNQASKGWASVPDDVKALLPDKCRQLIDKGKSLKPDDWRHLVLGRLTENVTEGKDGGVHSAKLLGSIRELNMFTPELSTGIVVLSAPGRMMEKRGKMLEGIVTEENKDNE